MDYLFLDASGNERSAQKRHLSARGKLPDAIDHLPKKPTGISYFTEVEGVIAVAKNLKDRFARDFVRDNVAVGAKSETFDIKNVSGFHEAFAKISELRQDFEFLRSEFREISERSVDINNTLNSFEEVSKRTSVIHDIVFKTQILSFNAAIEAARAGSHGRGFSVVAEEVGKLAQKSKEAADEIQRVVTANERSVHESTSDWHQRITATQNRLKDFESKFDLVCSSVAKLLDNEKSNKKSSLASKTDGDEFFTGEQNRYWIDASTKHDFDHRFDSIIQKLNSLKNFGSKESNKTPEEAPHKLAGQDQHRLNLKREVSRPDSIKSAKNSEDLNDLNMAIRQVKSLHEKQLKIGYERSQFPGKLEVSSKNISADHPSFLESDSSARFVLLRSGGKD